MIRESLECFIPVIQNQTDYLIHNLILNNTFSPTNFYNSVSNFSLSTIDYLDVEVLIPNPSTLLGRTLMTHSSRCRGLVKDVFTINNRLLLEISYSSNITFNKQEDVFTIIETPGQEEITLKILTKYFRRPKSIISNTDLEKRLNLLQFNNNYLITKFRDSFYEFNNVIVIIFNRISKQKEVYFIQEDQRTAILI